MSVEAGKKRCWTRWTAELMMEFGWESAGLNDLLGWMLERYFFDINFYFFPPFERVLKKFINANKNIRHL